MDYALYLHIPCCKARCLYCDFYTNGGQTEVEDGYITSLAAAFARFAPKDAQGGPLRPASVYFGGGTPSLLAPRQVAALLKAANPQPGAEVTLEANPDSASEAKLEGYRAAGVNRLSLGVQSARDESLRRLGRPHTARQAREALAAARRAGFENISGDIMLALPGYTTAEFDETLALLCEGGATHVSAYLLKIEPGTPFGAAPPAGLPTADEAADFYSYAAGQLEGKGYARYEISNFARPGFEGRHNLTYWDTGNWLGLGPGAHSSLLGRRFSFAPQLTSWLAAPAPQPEGQMDAGDYIMLRLRLREGLDLAALKERFGAELSQSQLALLQKLCAGSLAQQTKKGFALTTKGLLVQNSILARLLAD